MVYLLWLVRNMGIEEFKEDNTKVNNYCESCKKYHKLSISGTCPVCGGKLSRYRPNRRYYTNESKDKMKWVGKLATIDSRCSNIESNLRMKERKIENLELRYLQMINLLKGILRYHAGFRRSGSKRLNSHKIIEWIEKVVNEPEEREVDLVEELVNPEQVEKELK